MRITILYSIKYVMDKLVYMYILDVCTYVLYMYIVTLALYGINTLTCTFIHFHMHLSMYVVCMLREFGGYQETAQSTSNRSRPSGTKKSKDPGIRKRCRTGIIHQNRLSMSMSNKHEHEHKHKHEHEHEHVPEH